MASPTVLAAFQCAFDDLHGPTLVGASSSASASAVELDGIEWAALPSGLHAVDEDSFFFDWHGALAVCHFSSVASSGPANVASHAGPSSSSSGGRGRTMVTSGLLVVPPARPPSAADRCARSRTRRSTTEPGPSSLSADFAHEIEAGRLLSRFGPVLRRATGDADANTDADGWEGWANGLLAAGRSAEAAGDVSASVNGDDGARPAAFLTDEADLSHPLAALPLLPPALLLPLAKILPNPSARILLLTKPPLGRACDLAWALSAVSRLSFSKSMAGGGRHVSGSSKGLTSLGVVGLGSIDSLRERVKRGEGWIAVTTDALFRERPELYDVLLELDASATDDEHLHFSGRLTLSRHPPAASQSSSSDGRPSARPPRSTTSPLGPTWWDGPLLSTLELARQTGYPISDHDERSPGAGRASPATAWLGALWDGCGWCLGLLLGQAGAGERGANGSVYLPLATDDDDVDGSATLSDSDDDREQDNGDDVPKTLWPARAILQAVASSNNHLSHHLTALVPSGPSPASSAPVEPERQLSSVDLVRLGLSPLGTAADRMRVSALSQGRVVIGERWI